MELKKLSCGTETTEKMELEKLSFGTEITEEDASEINGGWWYFDPWTGDMVTFETTVVQGTDFGVW